MKRILMLVGILVAAACGGDGKPGPGGGGGDDLTVGDVCDQLVQAACDKARDCGEDVDGCEDTLKSRCCTGSKCDATAAASQDDVDECVDDIGALSCSASSVPASCDL